MTRQDGRRAVVFLLRGSSLEEPIILHDTELDRTCQETPINLLGPKHEDEEDNDPFASSEDMEQVGVFEDEYRMHAMSDCGNSNCMRISYTHVHGPSEFSLSEFVAIQLYDVDSGLQPNEVVLNGLSKVGKGASTPPNSTVFGAMPPGSSSVLALAS